jgi:hypothetical protein
VQDALCRESRPRLSGRAKLDLALRSPLFRPLPGNNAGPEADDGCGFERQKAGAVKKRTGPGAANFLKAEPTVSPPNKFKPEILAYARCSW